jgi:hypothetical protein
MKPQKDNYEDQGEKETILSEKNTQKGKSLYNYGKF